MTEHVSFSKQLGVVDPEVSRPPRYVDEGVHVSANTETAKSGRVVRQSSIIAARAAQIAAGEPLEIFKVVTEPDDPLAFGEGWHTDLTFLQTPPLAAVLIARQPSSQGTGKTLFLSAFAAYDALSDHTRAALHNCHALHTDQAGRNVWHPAVNHIGGRTGLFVNRHFTKSLKCRPINGSATPDEWEDVGLMEHLFNHLVSHGDTKSGRLEISWSTGDMVIWDERTTQHAAQHDYSGQRREMHRVIISPQPDEQLSRSIDAAGGKADFCSLSSARNDNALL